MTRSFAISWVFMNLGRLRIDVEPGAITPEPWVEELLYLAALQSIGDFLIAELLAALHEGVGDPVGNFDAGFRPLDASRLTSDYLTMLCSGPNGNLVIF
ncbi:MAG TPA: hypothetical protein QGG18_07275 [Rhodospirillales bacterium]|nr:hypothetical protein [Rhodospirillales bacterium]